MENRLGDLVFKLASISFWLLGWLPWKRATKTTIKIPAPNATINKMIFFVSSIVPHEKYF
jgi:hypothetical protein